MSSKTRATEISCSLCSGIVARRHSSGSWFIGLGVSVIYRSDASLMLSCPCGERRALPVYAYDRAAKVGPVDTQSTGIRSHSTPDQDVTEATAASELAEKDETA